MWLKARLILEALEARRPAPEALWRLDPALPRWLEALLILEAL